MTRRIRTPALLLPFLFVIAFAAGCAHQTPLQKAYAARLQYNAIGEGLTTAHDHNQLGDDAFAAIWPTFRAGAADIDAMESAAMSKVPEPLNWSFLAKSNTVSKLLDDLIAWRIKHFPPTTQPASR